MIFRSSSQRSPIQRMARRVAPVVFLVAVVAAAAAPSRVCADEPTRGEAYASMKFGIFMHFGPATFIGKTPWKYNPRRIDPTVFNPPHFDPDQWMRAIKASGARYIIFTTKHHDGFVMWPSKYTDFGVAASGIAGVDVVGEVVEAAREHGLKVVFYYSWYDKLHPGGNVRKREPSKDYIEYVKHHLEELLTGYGPIAGIWLDTPVHAREAGIAEYIHELSPETAFVWKNFANGRVTAKYPAADVLTFEGPAVEMVPADYEGIPVEQTYNVAAGPGWWQASNEPPREGVEKVASLLALTERVDGALSLNVSPGPSGRIPPASVKLLEEIGSVTGADRETAHPQ